MIEPGSDEARSRFIAGLRPGQVLTAVVAGVDGREVILDLPGPGGIYRRIGRVLESELSWRRGADPAAVVQIRQELPVEVVVPSPPWDAVLVSARACEDPALRDFLLRLRPGDVVTGTVSETQPFGVFVRLDGEPPGLPTGLPGTGFINVPELSWSRFRETSDIVTVGQRVTTEVLGSDTRRGQISLSLKSLREEDPFLPWANQVGRIVTGHVSLIAPIGVFVRLTEGVEGLLRPPQPHDERAESPPERMPEVGEEVTVLVADVDPLRRRITLDLAHPPEPTR